MRFPSLVVAEMQAASALISIGAVLGKTNPVHLVLIALLEVSGFVLNGWLLQTLLEVSSQEVQPHLHFQQLITLKKLSPSPGSTSYYYSNDFFFADKANQQHHAAPYLRCPLWTCTILDPASGGERAGL